MEQVLQRATVDKPVGRLRLVDSCPLILDLQGFQNFAINEILDKKWKIDHGKRKVMEFGK